MQSFSAVFEDLWTNSADIHEKIEELENGKPTPMGSVIDDNNNALKTYDEVIGSAKEEIIMITSSEGLVESWKRIERLRELAKRGVSVKVMAPLTKENWQATQELLQCCSVRHTPPSYLESTIVDGKHLIQSRSQLPYDKKRERIPYFGTLITNDLEYVKKTKDMLYETWRNASAPSGSTLDSFIKTRPANVLSEEQNRARPESPHRKLLLNLKPKREVILEKDVLNKIINGKKYPVQNWPNDIVKSYGSLGIAIIHPPLNFNLPDMIIWAMHYNKQSSYGAADALLVFSWLETPKGNAYVPVTFVSDNPKQVRFHKSIASDTPSEHNSHLIKKDELQIRVQGNTLFAGWTVPIPLFPPSRILPPACIVFEGYGSLSTSAVEFGFPSGVKVTSEANCFDAFVTFFHPASKYSGPGTDGRINRDIITTLHPPRANRA